MSQAWILWGLSGFFSRLRKFGRWGGSGQKFKGMDGPWVPGPAKSVSVAMFFFSVQLHARMLREGVL